MVNPSPREVLMARHGQTEWNRVGRRQGQLDSPLTGLGRAQARAMAEATARLGPDAIFSSPLGRAATTAACCARRVGLSVELIEQLAEVNHGEMAGMTNAEIEAAYPGQLGRRSSDLYQWRFPGGESYADADRRARGALDVVKRSGASRPLLVSHEMIGRMLMHHLLHVDVATALRWSHPQNVIYRIDLVAGTAEEIPVSEATE